MPDQIRDHEIGIVWADDEDLRKIVAYVNNLRFEAEKKNNQAVLPLIDGFRDWYNDLGWYDTHIMINDTMRDAIARRDTIDLLMGKVTKAEVPKPSFVADLVSPVGSADSIPLKYKIGAALAAIVFGVGWVAKKVYVDPFMKRS